YQQIIFLTMFQNKSFDIFKAWKIGCITAFGAQLFCQKGGGHTEGVCLAGCIDIRQYHMVCQGECVRKFMEKCFRAGISVRLENTPCFPVRIVSCSTKRGSDLCRMVRVVVYNVKSVFVSFVLEAPVCTGKGKEPFLDLFHRDIQK